MKWAGKLARPADTLKKGKVSVITHRDYSSQGHSRRFGRDSVPILAVAGDRLLPIVLGGVLPRTGSGRTLRLWIQCNNVAVVRLLHRAVVNKGLKSHQFVDVKPSCCFANHHRKLYIILV
jgi:hypothetical protein